MQSFITFFLNDTDAAFLYILYSGFFLCVLVYLNWMFWNHYTVRFIWKCCSLRSSECMVCKLLAVTWIFCLCGSIKHFIIFSLMSVLIFPPKSAFPPGGWEMLPIKTFPFKNRCSNWQKTSCLTMECLAAVLGPDLWPPTCCEDHSLITDNYYEPDAPRESGKKYYLWTLNLAEGAVMVPGSFPDPLQFVSAV